MTLTLVVVSLNDQALSQPITASFDARGGTIGRADHNTMALPDPERHISRLQAEIVAHGPSFVIRNVGTANPIIVSGRSLGQGETARLTDADQIRIGGYLLKVQHAAEPARPATVAPVNAAPPPAPRPAAAPAATPVPPPLASDNPFAGLLGSASTPAADPFADLMPPPAGVDARSPALVAPAAPARSLLPDDFDPFAPTKPPQPVQTPAGPAPAPDPFADFMPGAGAGGSIDEFIGAGADTRDPLAHFMADLSAPPPAADKAGALSADPLALFGPGGMPAAPKAAPPPVGLPQRDDVPARHAVFTPPRVGGREEPAFDLPRVPPPTLVPLEPPPPSAPVPSPVTPPVARAPAPTLPARGDAALWEAFCAGAGIAVPLAPNEGAERMHALGRIMRSAIEGTLQLMQVRASTKHELRASVTIIRQRDNNPLKFSPDGKAGLEQLLQPPLRGFLDGPAAMDDAMRDLVGHAIGTVAGMRAAVEGMLDRFAPDALESKLVGSSMLDSVLPMNRKARLWDLYLQHHRSIREEAQEDFQNLFGKAFLAAYEQQVERLRRGRTEL